MAKTKRILQLLNLFSLFLENSKCTKFKECLSNQREKKCCYHEWLVAEQSMDLICAIDLSRTEHSHW